MIEAAASIGPHTDAASSLPVLARATLLLRVASAACSRALRLAGVTREDLRFWWQAYGEDSGLWPPGDEPDEFADLQQDVVETVKAAETAARQDGFCVAALCGEYAQTAATMGQFQRACLWSLGL